MSELEEKLSALMSNPQLMEQISAMAQAMGSPQPEPEPETKGTSQQSIPMPDPRLLQFFSQTMGRAGVDDNQEALLQALAPYLSGKKVQKLERAMRAARLAGTASSFLNSGGLQLLTGR